MIFYFVFYFSLLRFLHFATSVIERFNLKAWKSSLLDIVEEIRDDLNPEITEKHGECTLEEGCLSFPGVYASVTRPEKIVIKAQDQNGNPFEKQSQDYEARCFMHELDHLNGITFDQYVSPMVWKEAVEKAKKKLEDNA